MTGYFVSHILTIVTVLNVVFQYSVVASNLYPHGLDERDVALPRDTDDISSAEVRLVTPIVFYGQSYPFLFVNQNGLVTFLTQLPSFLNIQFPLDYPAIAPYYSDVDTRITGSIFYRESQDTKLLERARSFLVEHFSSADSFNPHSLFIATWLDVGSYDRKSDKIFRKGTPAEMEELLLGTTYRNANTFQLIITSDGSDSYVILLYDQIEWIQGTGKNPSLPDAKAQAGFISGNGPHFLLPGSGTDQVSSLYKRSNLGMDGIWAFRVGRVSEVPEEPNLNIGERASEESSSCTDGGATTCHSRAECIDYSPGFCCKCVQGYYGNGRTCLEDAIPTRAGGKVRGVLNGIAIEDAELFSYIVPVDGRTYTAIAKIPERLGFDLQSTSAIAIIFGWLFSKTSNGAVNGFQLTGAVFNYTAEISFLQTGHKVTVSQAYVGFDVFNQLKVDTRIHGTTGVIPKESKLEVQDHEMLFTRVSPGVIRSQSNHNYRLEGTSMDNPFTVEQTISYDECPWASALPSNLQTLKMKVVWNYIAYTSDEQIVRYAVTSMTTPPDGEDPCKENRNKCGPNSSCVASGSSFTCICNLGYEERYVEGSDGIGTSQCSDIDECRMGLSDCDVTAHCTNSQGSYTCHCREGYVGNGFNCAKILTCADVQCGANAVCHEVPPGPPECQCMNGFDGDGVYCIPRTGNEGKPDDRQSSCHNCDKEAECLFNPTTNAHICRCREGFEGDGYKCSQYPHPTEPQGPTSDCRELEICDRYADCLSNRHTGVYECSCRFPFIGDGFTCRDSRVNGQPTAHPTPECTFGDRCFCPIGFHFDDLQHRCLHESAQNLRTCNVDPSVCDVNAPCVHDHNGFRCVCNTGFDGDGKQCLPKDLCRSHSECGKYGECKYNRAEIRYKCECRDGFSRDNGECHAGSTVGCDVLNNCDVNGRCVWESLMGKYLCECKPGYLGDGHTCRADLTGCNVLNNCGRNAECSYDTIAKAYKCHCRQGFSGDGFRCRSLTPCYQDRTVCHSRADCLPNPISREWNCQCSEGFAGDGYECQEKGTRDSSYLVIAKGMSLINISLDGSTQHPIQIDPFQTAVGIDIDCPNERIYWSDISGRKIKSSFLNGTNTTIFTSGNIGSPEGVSIDWSGQNLYWTDSTKDTIEVANLNTQLRKTLFSTDLVNPRAIVVYPQRGRLYWSDWNRDYPKIEFSGLDGNGRQILIGEGLALPNALIVDPIRDQICFADAGTHRIECVGIDGRNRTTIVSQVRYAFGLTLGSDNFYWSDWNTTSIENASRRTGIVGQRIEIFPGGAGNLYGLVAVPNHCPRAFNPCSQNPCPDGFLCLPNMRAGRTCTCPDSVSNSTCIDFN